MMGFVYTNMAGPVGCLWGTGTPPCHPPVMPTVLQWSAMGCDTGSKLSKPSTLT